MQELRQKWEDKQENKRKKNLLLFQRRFKKYNIEYGPKVGEFLKFKGKYVRFSHDWGNLLQTSNSGSFYLGDGYISFSGSLNDGVAKKDIELISELRYGYVWFKAADILGV